MIIAMEPILERCCGIDVHKKTIVACLMVGKAHEEPNHFPPEVEAEWVAV